MPSPIIVMSDEELQIIEQTLFCLESEGNENRQCFETHVSHTNNDKSCIRTHIHFWLSYQLRHLRVQSHTLYALRGRLDVRESKMERNFF